MKNLLCVSLLCSAVCLSASPSFSADAKMSRQETNLYKATYSLPKKDGDEFRQTLREADEENQKDQQQIVIDHADMYDLLTAPDFDKKAFLAKAEEIRKLQLEEKTNRDEAFAAAVTQLSVKQRVTLANAIETASADQPVHHSHHKKTTNTDSNASDTGTSK